MEVTRSGGYSGWEPNVDSPILKAMKESYKAQFGTEPALKVIHAGLECGIIGAVVPGLDMISFGPTLRSPHSPDERCFIPSEVLLAEEAIKAFQQWTEKSDKVEY